MSASFQKVALVTGAARGIGLAVARHFLAEGWCAALLDIERELLRESLSALGSPDRTLGLVCDVADESAVTEVFAGLERRFGRLDALINNAGVAVFAPLMETSNAEWRRVLEVNLTGAFLCTKAAVPLMRERGGAIVNITSISAVRILAVDGGFEAAGIGLPTLRGKRRNRWRLQRAPFIKFSWHTYGTLLAQTALIFSLRSNPFKDYRDAYGNPQSDLVRCNAVHAVRAAGAGRNTHPGESGRTGRAVS